MKLNQLKPRIRTPLAANGINTDDDMVAYIASGKSLTALEGIGGAASRDIMELFATRAPQRDIEMMATVETISAERVEFMPNGNRRVYRSLNDTSSRFLRNEG